MIKHCLVDEKVIKYHSTGKKSSIILNEKDGQVSSDPYDQVSS